MQRYDDYLLMSDLDGTLIGTDHKVSQENVDAINRFTQQGGSFAVATGRTVQGVQMHIQGLPLNGPCILYNGAALYSFAKAAYLSTEHLQKELFTGFLADCMHSFPKMVVEIFTPDGMYIVTPPQNIDPYVALEGHAHSYCSLTEALQLEWIKILLNDQPSVLLRAQEKMKAYRLEQISNRMFTQVDYLELLPLHVTKGAALQTLRRFPAYAGKIIVAVGDYDNDIEMIEAADIGVAMGNAAEHIKAIADEITVSNEQSAMADIIDRIIPLHARRD